MIAAALGMAPALVELLAGKRAGGLVEAAAEAIAGTSDPEAIRNLPPDQQAQLRQELARIALEVRRAELADVANAREMGSKSGLIAWAQVGGAAAVLLLFGSLLLIFAMRGVPEDRSGIFTMALGVLTTLVPLIAGFFYGNATAANAANARIDRIAASAAPVLALPAPATTDDLNAASLARARGNP